MKCKTIALMMVLVITGYFVSAQGTRVNPGTGIRVESGTFLDIGNGDLILESDATGDASLLDYGSVSFSGAGTAQVERYLTEGRWHLVSSPITDAVSGMFINDYLQRHNEPNNAWYDIAPVDVPLAVMKGYALWSIDGAPSTELFTGVTNTGALYRDFTKTGLGWNLMGNPYPSCIDWDEVSIPSQMNGAFWLFDPTIGSNGDYRYYITGGGGANTTSRFIPSGQGFFVKAVSGAGTLNLDNLVRAHSTQDFYKSDVNEAMLILTAEGNSITTQTAVRFNENATTETDRLYDVDKIFTTSPEVPILFTRSASGDLAINTLPSIEGNEVVPAWFRAGKNGLYKIMANELQSFDPATPIYLYDMETGTSTNLRKNSEYSFDYSTGSDKAFLILFSDPSTMNTTNSGIRIYGEGNQVHVDLPLSYLSQTSVSAQIMIYDLNGQKVMETRANSLNNTVTFTGSNNIYMVKVITGTETAHAKVFLNTK